jgi:nucleotide-binding universal stress UspA family protein
MFQRVVVPVANQEDAANTTAALAPYVGAIGGTVIAVHVIEKAGGALDKASVEQREQDAEDMFAVVTDGLADTGVTLETDIYYGTDVAATILEAAHDADATAIVFTPRGGSRWQRLLTGDVTHELVTSSDVPVLVLPDRDDGDEQEADGETTER